MKEHIPTHTSSSPPETDWSRIYVGVIVVNLLVFAALWSFSVYFSS